MSPVSPPMLVLTLSRRCAGPRGRGLEGICPEKEWRLESGVVNDHSHMMVGTSHPLSRPVACFAHG